MVAFRMLSSIILAAVFGTGSGFRVGWRTAGKFNFCFEEFFASISGIFILAWRGGGGAGRGAIILWGLDTFLIFLICLVSKLLSFKLLGILDKLSQK